MIREKRPAACIASELTSQRLQRTFYAGGELFKRCDGRKAVQHRALAPRTAVHPFHHEPSNGRIKITQFRRISASVFSYTPS